MGFLSNKFTEFITWHYEIILFYSDSFLRQLPELLYYILELRFLVQQHDGVIKRYYSQYVTGYDALILTDIVQSIENLGEKESVLLSDFCADLSHISRKLMTNNFCSYHRTFLFRSNFYILFWFKSIAPYLLSKFPYFLLRFDRVSEDSVDLRSLRLDWFRFQAYVSMSRSSFSLNSDRRLAVTMNTTIFHLKMIDLIDEMLRETSDLSIYWLVWLLCFQKFNYRC